MCNGMVRTAIKHATYIVENGGWWKSESLPASTFPSTRLPTLEQRQSRLSALVAPHPRPLHLEHRKLIDVTSIDAISSIILSFKGVSES